MERTRKQWNNLIVDENVWEPRQPQDLVRGVKDNQTVADARPLSPNVFTGPIYVTILQDVEIGAEIIYVDSIAGLTIGNNLGVMMDNGIEFPATLVSIDPGGAFITISAALPYPASSGNLLVDYRTFFFNPPSQTYHVELESGSGSILLESGGYILLESAP